jgi:(p)ppGpp synthase/HD superfamily hydrolase
MEKRETIAAGTSLTTRFEQALAYTIHLHGAQTRRGTSITYVAHLLSVAALVLEDGGSEDEAIAALLHDAIEHQGGLLRYEDIRRRFGDLVAGIVWECSDSHVADPSEKPSWEERKRAYLATLPSKSPEALRVSVADKLHNARAILLDLRTLGDEVWDRFNRNAAFILWYYRSLADAFAELKPGPLAAELDRVVTELEQAASS